MFFAFIGILSLCAILASRGSIELATKIQEKMQYGNLVKSKNLKKLCNFSITISITIVIIGIICGYLYILFGSLYVLNILI